MKKTASMIQESSSTKVKIRRKTAESDIEVGIECNWKSHQSAPRQCEWNTSIKFLNHMIQTICRRASLNIDLKFTCVLEATFAQHVVWEDIGLVIGVGISELLNWRRQEGVEGAGYGVACIDEALANCYLSFEGRSGCYINIIDSEAKNRELVEDAKAQDIKQFFEGFAQGARCTLHLNIGNATDAHHLWESAFRAFGEALRAVLKNNEWRKGIIVGVKDVPD